MTAVIKPLTVERDRGEVERDGGREGERERGGKGG